MTFEEWLSQADEDGLREANEFEYHYPIEQHWTMFSAEDDFEVGEEIHEVVCGCAPEFSIPYGHHLEEELYA